jgi:hypothetical protein
MISRKIFIGRVTVVGGTPASLYELMRDSPLHWGFETTALTTPSLDSIVGSEVTVIPDGQVRIGSDPTIVATNGINYAGGATINMQDFGMFGVIDPTAIYFSSISGTGMGVNFHAK